MKQRIAQLQEEMKQRNISVYLIPNSDFHETEYVGEHFKAVQFMSGFSGSAGTLVVCENCAGLYTDGRYFIQAEKQLENTGITLMKMGEPETPLMAQYIYDHLRENSALGMDGRCVSTTLAKALLQKIQSKNCWIACEEDLVGLLWENRPSQSNEKAFLLEEKYCGESAASKIQRLRQWMEEHKIDTHIITSLDDIAWLFNIRGKDIANYPVVSAYAMIGIQHIYFYVDLDKLNDTMRSYFKELSVTLCAYEQIYEDVKTIKMQSVLLDASKVNYKIVSLLPEHVTIQNRVNPTQLWKACKNEVELANIKKAHIKDGVAMVEFMYWLKNNINQLPMSEYSVGEYLKACRQKQENFISLSFDTISAYNENAAMMHYQAKADNCAKLAASGLLLVDSGGQYFEGTTDITRTFALGPISTAMRKHFTKVLKGMLNLSHAQFLYGCTGMNLDILARGILWKEGIDYKCGTGHGVGFVLNVHEGPNGFRWKKVVERNDSGTLEEGMVTTVEPGVYLQGEYGIRLENELVCKKGVANEYGQFMNFETVTYCPIDIDAIDVDLLNEEELQWLNEYHNMVYETLSPYLEKEVCEFLKTYTRKLTKDTL